MPLAGYSYAVRLQVSILPSDESFTVRQCGGELALRHYDFGIIKGET